MTGFSSHWSAEHIGIPHAAKGHGPDGCSCWGLVCHVYRRELGIVLPTYEEDYACLEEQKEIAILVGREKSRGIWRISDKPAPFDVLVFRQGRYETHTGLVVSAGRMLHVKALDQSKIEAFDAPLWKNRLIGIYRHVDAALKGAL